jgi:hypothetical protein
LQQYSTLPAIILKTQIDMPFTFSHPAIILPLTKYSGRQLSLTSLIIGSMTPDFEYFFRMKILSNFSHTIGGLFYFDLPVGIFFAFVFHNIIRNPLYENLPKTFRTRLENFKHFDWNKYFKQHYVVVIISTLLGAITHLFWDSFTHIHGYSVQTFPLLQDTFKLAGHEIPIYKIIQHLSTLLGGLFIIIAFFHLPKNSSNKRPINIKYWIAFFVITIAFIGLRLTFGIDKNILGQFIAISVTAILIALIFAPTLTRQKI